MADIKGAGGGGALENNFPNSFRFGGKYRRQTDPNDGGDEK